MTTADELTRWESLTHFRALWEEGAKTCSFLQALADKPDLIASTYRYGAAREVLAKVLPQVPQAAKVEQTTDGKWDVVELEAKESAVLEQALADALGAFSAELLDVPDLFAGEAWPRCGKAIEDGMLVLDARFAAFVERRYGEEGAKLAKEVREKARARWATAAPRCTWLDKLSDAYVGFCAEGAVTDSDAHGRALAEVGSFDGGGVAETMDVMTTHLLDMLERWKPRYEASEWDKFGETERADYLKKNGLAVPPMSVARGHMHMPKRVLDLLEVLWHAEVSPRLNAANGLTMRAVRVAGGDEYAKLPKLIAPLSWAFGAPGQTIEVDGDTYARAPDVAADVAAPKPGARKLVPRTHALLPHDWTPPHQTSLALVANEEPEVLPVAITTATHYAMTMQAAKIALVVLSSADVRAGKFACVKLGDLAKRVHAGTTRVQKPQLKATAEGVVMLRGLLAYLPDDTTIQIFDVQAPASPDRAKADMELLLGLSRTAQAILGREDETSLGRSYKGEFLFNMTGAMRLPNTRPALLRHLVRASAHWNAAFNPSTKAFDPNRQKEYQPRDWAILTNALPPAAVEYIQGKNTSKSRKELLSKATRDVRDELGELAEGHGLVRIEQKKGGTFKLLPPEPWLEAWRQMRATGGRPSSGELE